MSSFDKYWGDRLMFYANSKSLNGNRLHYLAEQRKLTKEAVWKIPPTLFFLGKMIQFWWQTFYLFFLMLVWVEPITIRANQPYRVRMLAKLRFAYRIAKSANVSFLSELLDFNEIALTKTDYWASEYLEKHPNATKLPLFLRLRYGVLFNLHKWHKNAERLVWHRRIETNQARKNLDDARKGEI